MKNLLKKILITQKGLEDLNKEYQELLNIKRPKIIQRIANARDEGDLSENSEYSLAKEELDLIENRISELKNLLDQAVVTTGNNNHQVGLGSLVTYEVNGVVKNLTVVGSFESNPLEKRISDQSPVGKALLGAKVGETVTIPLDPPVFYKIISIE